MTVFFSKLIITIFAKRSKLFAGNESGIKKTKIRR